MKKKTIGILLAAVTLLLAACGADKTTDTNETETTEQTGTDASAEETDTTESGSMSIAYDPGDYVTLGEYTGLDVTVSGDYDTDEEALVSYMQEKLGDADYVKDDTQTEVREDSIVNVDYTGYQDGVAFDGGAATDQTLDVKNNSSVDGTGFIDGFTAGLPGHQVGETVSYEVTFPENYGSATLAGQTVIFEFKINYICKPSVTAEDLDDAYVKEHFDAASVEEFKEMCRAELEEEVSEKKATDIRNAVITAVCNNATVSGYPEDVVEERLSANVASYISSAGSRSAFESYLSTYYGITEEEFKQELRSSLQESMESEMVFYAIAQKENMEVTDADFDSYVEDMMEKNEITSKDELLKVYGGSVEDGETYLRHICLCNKAVEYCVDQVGNVTIE